MKEYPPDRKRPLPRTVKVGYADYTIEPWEHAQADAANRYGETDRIRRIIRVDTSHGRHQAAETTLHELLHCVYGMWEMPDDKKKEERLVSIMAAGLATIWRDNPETFKWIAENLTA